MSTPQFGTWQPIETFNRDEMQFVLTYEDGAMRTMLWEPKEQVWEHPFPLFSLLAKAPNHTPAFWMPLPEPPEE